MKPTSEREPWVDRELLSGASDEHALEAQVELLERLVGTATDGIVITDREGQIRFADEGTQLLLGHGRAHLLGRTISDLVPADESERVTGRLLGLAGNGEDRGTETLETRLVTSSGESIRTEASAVSLTDEDGSDAGSVVVLRDISDRAERRRDLELLKKVLTRVFRHNVRNELTVIQGHAELVRLADDEDLADHGDAIVESARRLFDHSEKARLIERVVETESLTELDLGRAAGAAAKSLTWEHSDATVDVDVPAETVVEAHPEIRNAVEELIENAIVHTPPDEQPQVTVWLAEDDRTVTLYVEDNAGGLADHELEVLREGKETDLEHGSGVGLWLVRWLVEASAAELVVSRTDDGTLMGIQFSQVVTDE
jgi:PAS domain S-box-containing protein